MFLSAEKAHLVQKQYTRRWQLPLNVLAPAILCMITFTISYISLSFELRHMSYRTSLLCGPVLLMVLTGAVGVLATALRRRFFGTTLMLITVGMGSGTVVGSLLGDRNWPKYGGRYYNFEAMAQYVNLDPVVDKGGAFMDAGIVYFKEGSYVLKSKSLAFRNGARYCIAPIVRDPIRNVTEPVQLYRTSSGILLPRGGSVDYWAVGVNCCGDTVDPFTCGEGSFARSGLRVIDDQEQSMYQLAVQQWSATLGIPVRHPLFFTWVRDPIRKTENFLTAAWEQFWINFVVVAMVAFIVSFLLNMVVLFFRKM